MLVSKFVDRFHKKLLMTVAMSLTLIGKSSYHFINRFRTTSFDTGIVTE